MITYKKFLAIYLMGWMSGFTLMITGNTLNFWLAVEQIDIRTVGIFALVTMPYALHFLWTPIFDLVKIPFLYRYFGQRLPWIIIIQISLSVAIYLMSTFLPSQEVIKIAYTAILVAFLSSSQDAVLGGIRTEIVTPQDQVKISGIYIFGYRTGMIISSAGAIYTSQHIHWNIIYKLFSIMVLTFPIVLILLSHELKPIIVEINYSSNINVVTSKTTFQNIEFLINQVLQVVRKPRYVIVLLIFLLLYRLPSNLISIMINPFFIHIGYHVTTIATTAKLFGTICALVGGLVGSYMMRQYNIFDSLLLSGIIHAGTHLLFVIQNIYGINMYILFILVSLECLSGGLTMAVYIAFISTLCKGKFRSTQHAFFSSMMGLSRSVFASCSGYLAAHFGWTLFFVFTTVATIPSLVLIPYLNKRSITKI